MHGPGCNGSQKPKRLQITCRCAACHVIYTCCPRCCFMYASSPAMSCSRSLMGAHSSWGPPQPTAWSVALCRACQYLSGLCLPCHEIASLLSTHAQSSANKVGGQTCIIICVDHFQHLQQSTASELWARAYTARKAPAAKAPTSALDMPDSITALRTPSPGCSSSRVRDTPPHNTNAEKKTVLACHTHLFIVGHSLDLERFVQRAAQQCGVAAYQPHDVCVHGLHHCSESVHLRLQEADKQHRLRANTHGSPPSRC